MSPENNGSIEPESSDQTRQGNPSFLERFRDRWKSYKTARLYRARADQYSDLDRRKRGADFLGAGLFYQKAGDYTAAIEVLELARGEDLEQNLTTGTSHAYMSLAFLYYSLGQVYEWTDQPEKSVTARNRAQELNNYMQDQFQTAISPDLFSNSADLP